MLRAIVDVWREDIKYRMSRAKARLKFMVDDLGPTAFRAGVEEKLGRRLDDLAPCRPRPAREIDHLGIHPQKQRGLVLRRLPRPPWADGRRATMLHLADLAESLRRRHPPHPPAELHPQPTSPRRGVDEVVREVERLGFPLDGMGLRGASIACTGDPFCNYAVAETKGQLQGIVEHLEARLRRARSTACELNLDGCPHACAHHWIGDVGLQGTTLRERGTGGRAAAGLRPLPARRPRAGRRHRPARAQAGAGATEVHLVIERLFRAYLDGRGRGRAHSAVLRPPVRRGARRPSGRPSAMAVSVQA